MYFYYAGDESEENGDEPYGPLSAQRLLEQYNYGTR